MVVVMVMLLMGGGGEELRVDWSEGREELHHVLIGTVVACAEYEGGVRMVVDDAFDDFAWHCEEREKVVSHCPAIISSFIPRGTPATHPY